MSPALLITSDEATGLVATHPNIERLSLDEARAAVNAAEHHATQQFIREYEALIARYNRRLVGEVVLRSGALPDVRILVEALGPAHPLMNPSI